MTADAMPAHAAAPVTEAERVHALDALRGFALLGIFVSHIPDFSGWSFMGHEAQAALDRFGVDQALAVAQDFLIRGKFFSLFSLLFGIGFAVQLESAMRRGTDFARHFARRLSILLLIGLAHALVWYGDILKDYALIGLALIVTARWHPPATGRAALAVFALRVAWPFAILALFAAYAAPAPASAPASPAAGFSALAATAIGATDPVNLLLANLDLVKLKALQMIYDGKAVSVLGMFLLGAYIGRRGMHRDIAASRPLLRRILLIATPIGLAGNAVLVPLAASVPAFPPSLQWAIAQALFAVAVPAMTLAYAAGFALLWQSGAGRVLHALAPAGQMALTSYVSQTLAGVVVFYAIGLDRAGTIGLAEGTLFALGIFAVQCAVNALWLRAFRYGPLEWVWRRATYGQPVAFRR